MSTENKALDFLRECLSEIPSLRRRGYDDPEFGLWYEKVEAILQKAFTQKDSKKFSRSWPNYNGLSAYQSQKEYRKLLQHYETALRSIMQKYEIREKLSSQKEPIISSSDMRELSNYPFNAMRFHPKVIEASESLFKNGHYAQATFEAFKTVENFVKDKSGLSLYGKQLMAQAFNEERPLIRVVEDGKFDKDVQEGFKFLFMGATLGIRNPKAHQNIVQNDPFITLEYLGLASFLIKRIEGWEVD